LDTGYWILEVGGWRLETGDWRLDSRKGPFMDILIRNEKEEDYTLSKS